MTFLFCYTVANHREGGWLGCGRVGEGERIIIFLPLAPTTLLQYCITFHFVFFLYTICKWSLPLLTFTLLQLHSVYEMTQPWNESLCLLSTRLAKTLVLKFWVSFPDVVSNQILRFSVYKNIFELVCSGLLTLHSILQCYPAISTSLHDNFKVT